MSTQDIVDIARSERETLRWILLYALWSARPYGTTEYVLIRTAQDIPLLVTQDLVRREMESLASRGMISIEKNNQPLWHARITALGEDVVEYREDAPKGIARPPKW